jgi:hypothetical protein
MPLKKTGAFQRNVLLKTQELRLTKARWIVVIQTHRMRFSCVVWYLIETEWGTVANWTHRLKICPLTGRWDHKELNPADFWSLRV